MFDNQCPVSYHMDELVSLAHGGGGKPSQDLIRKAITPMYGQGFAPDHDGATFPLSGKVAFTSDSFVVKPMFFPGGDIGKLAVYGTVNDLAMCGAKPIYLSCSLIIEEGLPFSTLNRICKSMSDAASEANVKIVTGDTKVVGRGQADGLYINTSGVGVVADDVLIHPSRIEAGDQLILSGDLGRHGMAILIHRENLAVEGELMSDCAPLAQPVQRLLDAGIRPKCLRDLTRGGLASALHEISSCSSLGIEIHESKILVNAIVRGACEVLGLDPIYIANEGRFLAIVDECEADRALSILQRESVTSQSVIIGKVGGLSGVEVVGPYGSRRILPQLLGEILPRIC